MATITGNLFRAIAERVSALDSEAARAAYRAGRFPRADSVENIDRRYRWDLFWAARAWELVPDDSGIADAHIDTALRRIVPPLEH